MQSLKIIPQLFIFASISFTGIAEAACSGAESRYTLQGSDTEVLDNATGLTWKRCSEGLSGASCATGSADSLDWKAAVESADTSWRLPNIKELASLLEPECTSPSINTTIFPVTASAIYWTATPDTVVATSAWQVDFGNGSTSSAIKTSTAQLRLVKDQ